MSRPGFLLIWHATVLAFASALSSSTLVAQQAGNGINVGDPKVYDSAALENMLKTAVNKLQGFSVYDQASLTGQLGKTQGATSDQTQTSLQANSAKPGAASQQSPQNSQNQSFSLPSGYTPSSSAVDLLNEQTQLNFQIASLQLLLQGALSDRFVEGSAVGKTQVTLGFPITVTVPPGFQYREAVAEAQVAVCLPPGTYYTDLSQSFSLVNLIPQEKTYNVATITSNLSSIGGGAVAGALNLAGGFLHGRQTYYIVKDQDTLAIPRPSKAGFCQTGKVKIKIMTGDGRTTFEETSATDGKALAFAWQFRPVLGQKVVRDGVRQTFAQIALPPNKATYLCSAIVYYRTSWRRYDSKLGRVGNIIPGTQGDWVPHRFFSYDQAPAPRDVFAQDNGNGTVTVTVTGTFKTGTQVRVGGQIIDSTASDNGIRFTASGSDLALIGAKLVDDAGLERDVQPVSQNPYLCLTPEDLPNAATKTTKAPKKASGKAKGPEQKATQPLQMAAAAAPNLAQGQSPAEVPAPTVTQPQSAAGDPPQKAAENNPKGNPSKESKKTKAEEVAQKAAKSAAKAKAAEKGAVQAKKAAQAAASEAMQSKNLAEAAVNSANQAKNAAEGAAWRAGQAEGAAEGAAWTAIQAQKAAAAAAGEAEGSAKNAKAAETAIENLVAGKGTTSPSPATHVRPLTDTTSLLTLALTVEDTRLVVGVAQARDIPVVTIGSQVFGLRNAPFLELETDHVTFVVTNDLLRTNHKATWKGLLNFVKPREFGLQAQFVLASPAITLLGSGLGARKPADKAANANKPADNAAQDANEPKCTSDPAPPPASAKPTFSEYALAGQHLKGLKIIGPPEVANVLPLCGSETEIIFKLPDEVSKLKYIVVQQDMDPPIVLALPTPPAAASSTPKNSVKSVPIAPTDTFVNLKGNGMSQVTAVTYYGTQLIFTPTDDQNLTLNFKPATGTTTIPVSPPGLTVVFEYADKSLIPYFIQVQAPSAPK